MTLHPSTWDFWVAIGFAGQFLFAARFIVQWIASEKRGVSHVPVAFWFFSIFGGSIMLAYAIHRRDPVFIVGQASGLIVYTRNLMLIHQHRSDAGPRADSHVDSHVEP